MSIVSQVGCVVCRELTGEVVPCHVHHISEGSSERNDFMTAGLCHEHHVGKTGVHGAGVKKFLSMYRLPTEFHLIGLFNKFRTRDRI